MRFLSFPYIPYIPFFSIMECSICTDILSIRTTQLVCGHRFHAVCLDTWLQMGAMCPNCRGPATLHASEAFRNIALEAAAEALVWQEEWAAEAAAKAAVEAERKRYEKYIATHGAAEMAATFRPLVEPNTKVLKSPLSCIYEGEKNDYCWTDTFRCSNLTTDYRVSAFCEGLLGEEAFDIGNFPNNITEYYWIHAGTPDEEAWYLLCQIQTPTGPAYAFYVAKCSYTGFEYGGMRMWVSKDPQRLFYEGLTEANRKLCLEEKGTGKQRPRRDYWQELLDEAKKPDAPPAPETSGYNAVNPTKAYVRLFHNNKELRICEEDLNMVEVDEVTDAIRGLTATFLDPKPARPVPSLKPRRTHEQTPGLLMCKALARGGSKHQFCPPLPRRKFFFVKKAIISNIDDVFKRRFGNPDKRWALRVRQGPTCRAWGKVEVQFVLF